MIALKCAMFERKRGGWTNPYVTDGLVAMWDGEWNAGRGVHDADAIILKDLIGNADLHSFRLYQVDEKAVRGLWQASASEESMSVVARVLSSGKWSIQYAMGRAEGTRETLAILQHNTGNGMYGFLSYSNNNVYFCDGTNVSPRYGSVNSGVNNVGCAMHDDGGTTVQTIWPYYYGDTFQSNPTGTTSVAIKIPSSGYVGMGINNIGSSWIHSVRLYDRVLTQNEISANYAVDKARFSLS